MFTPWLRDLGSVRSVAEVEAFIIVVETTNVASLRVAEQAGARREGVLRNRLNSFGVPRDAVMFSLIPQDFQD